MPPFVARSSGLLASLARGLLPRPSGVAAALASTAALSGSRRVAPAALQAAQQPLRQSVGRALSAAVYASAAGGAGGIEVQLKVDGMVCDGCSSRVEEVLQKLPYVKKVVVDLDKGLATLEVEAASQADALGQLPALVDVVNGLGFEARPVVQ